MFGNMRWQLENPDFYGEPGEFGEFGMMVYKTLLWTCFYMDVSADWFVHIPVDTDWFDPEPVYPFKWLPSFRYPWVWAPEYNTSILFNTTILLGSVSLIGISIPWSNLILE